MGIIMMDRHGKKKRQVMGSVILHARVGSGLVAITRYLRERSKAQAYA